MNVFSIQSGALIRNEITLDDYYNVSYGDLLGVPAPGILGNDLALSGGTLSAILRSKPNKGIVTLNSDGSFVYTPYPKSTGTDIFTYIPVENGIWGNYVSVTLNINSPQPTIKATGLYYNAQKNTVLESGVQFEFINHTGNFSRLELVEAPQHGSVTFPTEPINGNYFSYTPEADYV